MLVLSRKKSESIVIDDNIVITIVEIRGDKVRLGIQAPKDVSIHRNEIYEAIRNSQMNNPQINIDDTNSQSATSA
jgi:carbon storage regulator